MVGTAGWTIPLVSADAFPAGGTHLERYSRRLHCVEINSSFYRPHRATVYEKWASQTPRHFRFSVKLPKLITHTQRLRRTRLPLTDFVAQVRGLRARLGPLLVQLPPSLEFSVRAAGTFFRLLRGLHDGPVVCEPRHKTWFLPKAEALLHRHRVGRVAADPAVAPAANRPAGWTERRGMEPDGVAYYRLHGSPQMYWSSYPAERLAIWSAEIWSRADTNVWCVFDNTAMGAATANALDLQLLASAPRRIGAGAPKSPRPAS
ncbi:MAG: DUF72 domain-containing protein [Gammaproteobacteria bacterium]